MSELVMLMRLLGIRGGWRAWLIVRNPAPSGRPTWEPAHGEKPRMPGYRRRRTR